MRGLRLRRCRLLLAKGLLESIEALVATVTAVGKQVEQTQESVERVPMCATDFGGRIARAALWHHVDRMSPLMGTLQEMQGSLHFVTEGVLPIVSPLR